MGLSQALFSAISGLVSHQRAMDNIGNNLANVNTVAFKKGVFQFRTLLEQNLRGGQAADASTGRGAVNPLSIGLGTQVGSINKDFRQGSVEITGNQRDMMIDGNGYFVLKKENSNVYTRDGTFYVGEDGSLLGGDGLKVQGIPAENGAIPVAGTLDNIVIPIGQTGAAKETTKVSFTGNLNSDVQVAAPNVVANPTDTTWDAVGVGSSINVGHVESSAGLWDTSIPGRALSTTALGNLQFLRGNTLITPFNGVANGDKVTVSWRKGGRKQTATFTYGQNTAVPLTGDGTTVADFARFLGGGLNDATTGVGAERLTGGAMGTIHARQRSQTAPFTDPYNAAEEHGGAFMRTFTAAQAGSVDYGVITPGVNDTTTRLSFASNLGSESALTNIEVSYNNVNYADMFSPDLSLGAIQGGSTSANLEVFDSLGNQKIVNMTATLVNRDTNFSTYRWIAESTDDTDATWLNKTFNAAAVPTTSITIGTGLFRFDANGQYVRGDELSATQGISMDLNNQGVNTPLNVQITEGLSTALNQDLDFSNLSQVATASDLTLKAQDGSAPGTLDTFTVTADGVIQGIFSNGVVNPLARLSIALVPNETGLLSVGGNLFLESPSSGAAQIGFASAGGRGSIRSGAIEGSNVDLSEEFTKLITTQRGFQANARVITTSDEMLVELVNMKR